MTTFAVRFGANDLSAGRTLAQIQADKISIWTTFARQGSRVMSSTLLPKTTSTDSWATAGNQTVTAAETVRANFNDWLRAGGPMIGGAAVAIGTSGAIVAGQAGHPLWAAINACRQVEANSSNVLTVNGGRWLATGTANAPTIDGAHPTAAYATIISAEVPQSGMVAF